MTRGNVCDVSWGWCPARPHRGRHLSRVTGTTFADGGFGFWSFDTPTFDDLKIGYDNNADDDIDDPGDDIIYDDDFAGTSISLTHDDNGNLTEGTTHKYTYDAWNP